MKYLTLLPFLLLLAACGAPEQQNGDDADSAAAAESLTLTQEERAAMKLTFSDVEQREAMKTISVPARIIEDPDRSAAVTALIDGRIEQVFVKQGQHVSRGQVLATVMSLEMGEMIAVLLRSESEMLTSEAAALRLRGLAAGDAASQKQLQEAEHALRSSRATAAAALQRLRAAGMTKEDLDALRNDPQSFEPSLKLRAPIAGVISMRDASIGQPVSPGRALFSIIGLGSALIEGSVFENDFQLLVPGQSVSFHTSAFPDREFRGTLSYIAPTVDNASHALPVRCSVPNAEGLLKPNMYGRLDILTQVPDSVRIVPQTAVVYDGSERFLFVMTGENTFSYRRVETGREFDASVEILNGVEAGERVVSGDVFHLKSRYKLALEPEEE